MSPVPSHSHDDVDDRRSGVPDLVRGDDGLLRCWWPGHDPDYVAYHDHEWGTRTRQDWDEHALFELLVLETFQSGLAWITILRKRDNFVRAFEGFDPATIATWGEHERVRLLNDAGIVRNRAKIDATLRNARAVLDLRAAGTSLVEVVFGSAPSDPGPRPRTRADIPASTPASTALARDLKSHGFSFVGPTVAHALMQSAGVVDDHLVGCHVVD